MITTWLGAVYLMAAAGISLFGLLGVLTLFFYGRHRRDPCPNPDVAEADLPPVSVQLPIYNERYVVRRLIDAAVRLDYPAERLQIQVLDDSTDDTTALAAGIVAHYCAQGVNIELRHRDGRDGFKAGALQAALASATGDFLIIFDADFVPEAGFLRQSIPYFVRNPRLGLIQTRWGHLNPNENTLTGIQVVALDKHFAIEQSARHRASLFPKFNGSAGVWRRRCLEDAGGWESDTVCEDLCLSTRAVLKGWEFQYLSEVVAPAELPNTMSAFKNQQARWAKGTTQCLLKYGPAIARDSQHPFVARLYALLSLSSYLSHVFLLLLLLAQLPLLILNFYPPQSMIWLGLLALTQPLLFVLGQCALYRPWWRHLAYFPALLLIGVGLAPSNSRAITQAIFSRRQEFIRTPKGRPAGGRRAVAAPAGYRLPFDRIILVELALALYAAAGLALCWQQARFGPAIFLAMCALGLGYVGLSTLQDQLQ